MRPYALLSLVTLLAGCPAESPFSPPPLGAFYFPTGLTHVDSPESPEGLLYVASSNFDKRFDVGSVTAVNLARVRGGGVGMPSFGAAVPMTGPLQLTELNVSDDGVVFTESFAGQMAGFALEDGGVRLFVPSRAEGSRLHVLEAPGVAGEGLTLSCFTPPQGGGNNCIADSPSLVELEGTKTGLPRAPEPYSMAIAADGELFVTHLQRADSPPDSASDFHSYLVRTFAQNPVVSAEDFIELGEGAGSGVAVGSRYAFVSGRSSTAPMVRLVDRFDRRVLDPRLQNEFRVADARGIALSADQRRLYLAGRLPDTLLVIDVQGATTSEPRLLVVRGVPLPGGANELAILPRAGRGNLVAVTSSSADVLSIYDDEAGAVVAQISSLGEQPFAIAVDERAPGARLYVSMFADGRVAVVDIPDLLRPQEARLVAHLGTSQTCLVDPTNAECVGEAR
ncbi:MAG: YncE family protein [Myxococcota bacterium]